MGTRRQRLHVLWVRWYERDVDHNDGFSALRLPRLSFVDALDSDAHGFIDPTAVLRAAHLIPAFSHDLMGPEPLPGCHATRFLTDDWNHYYANMYVSHYFLLIIQSNKCIISFVDRDMFMRYRGGGVGHKYMRAIEKWLGETGWGCKIPDIPVSEPQIVAEGEGGLQQEPISGEESEAESDSNDLHEVDKEDGSEDGEDGEDEETMEGEFGYSIF